MAENTIQKRQVAYKTYIKEIVDGTFIKKEGWEPSFVEDRFTRNLARVNIIGTVLTDLSEEGSAKGFYVDDGSSRIQIKTFDDIDPVKIGDVVLIIGKVREYNQEKYIIPEIIKRNIDPKWIEVRKKELAALARLAEEITTPLGDSEEKQQNTQTPKPAQDSSADTGAEPISIDDIEDFDEATEEVVDSTVDRMFHLIKELDSGDGADIGEIIKKSNDDAAEKIIKNMLMEGDIFEISPGKYKVLE